MEKTTAKKIEYVIPRGSVGDKSAFRTACWLFLVALFLLPDSFGIRIGILFTAKRVMTIICYLLIIFNKERLNIFWRQIKKSVLINVVVILYAVNMLLTAVYRRDLNSFMNDFLFCILILYLLIYILQNEIKIVNVQKLLEIALLVLAFFAVIEFATGFNCFSLLNTSGEFILTNSRQGNSRVTSICHHAIIFGWYMSMLTLLTCIDFKKNKLYLFRKPVHFVLGMIVVFLTGSRAPIGLFFVGAFLVVVFSNKDNLIKSLLIIAMFLIVFGGIIALTYKTDFSQYILRMITSAIDGVFGTTISYQFGGERFVASTEYRHALKQVFKLDYFNKFMGRGISYELSVVIDGYWLQSCDNTYVSMYISYAYPGLVLFALFLAIMVGYCLVGMFKYKIRACGGILAVAVIYLLLIWNVALMGSLAFVMCLYAFAYVLVEKEKTKKGEKNAIEDYQRRVRH